MTSLEARYRLLKCVALGGGIRTHNAQEAASGRPVMVHIMDGAEPEAAERLRAQVAALPPADRSRILEVTTTTSGVAVVSEFLSGLTTFPEWLDARAPAPVTVAEPETPPTPVAIAEADAPPAAPPAPTRPNTTESFTVGRVKSSRDTPPTGAPPPGEFTRLFQAAPEPASGGAPPPVTSSAPKAVPPAAPVVPNAPPPVASPLVMPPPVAPPPVATRPVPPAPPAREKAPPPPSEASPLKPGEFTALFRPPAAPSPGEVAPSPLVRGSNPPPAPPRAASSDASPRSPFGAGSGYGASAPPPLGASSSGAFAAPTPPAPDQRPALGTPAAPPPAARVHLAWSAPTSSPPPAPPPPELPTPPFGQAQGPPSPLGVQPSPLMGAGSDQAPLPPVIAPPVFTTPGAVGGGGAGVAPSPLAEHRASGPSDYTMLIRQSTTPPPPAPSPAAPAQVKPATPKRSLPLGLIITLNVVLVLAIALVLYFIFRPAPPNVEQGAPLPDTQGKVPTAAVPKVPAGAVPKAPAVPALPAVKP